MEIHKTRSPVKKKICKIYAENYIFHTKLTLTDYFDEYFKQRARKLLF